MSADALITSLKYFLVLRLSKSKDFEGITVAFCADNGVLNDEKIVTDKPLV